MEGAVLINMLKAVSKMLNTEGCSDTATVVLKVSCAKTILDEAIQEYLNQPGNENCIILMSDFYIPDQYNVTYDLIKSANKLYNSKKAKSGKKNTASEPDGKEIAQNKKSEKKGEKGKIGMIDQL